MATARPWVRPLFLVAAWQNVVIGVAYFVAFRPIYRALHLTLPSHDGYVQYPALLVLVFAAFFGLIAKSPERYRDFIPVGMLEKAAYAGVVFGYWAFGTVPHAWLGFAWLDLGWFIAFAFAFRAVPAGGIG